MVSSVIGCAMHMKWPDGIGLGSWDWENPRQGSANQIPALPVLAGHTVGCPVRVEAGRPPCDYLNALRAVRQRAVFPRCVGFMCIRESAIASFISIAVIVA